MLDRITEPLRLAVVGGFALGLGFVSGYLVGRTDGAAKARLEAAEAIIQEHEDWNDAESSAERLDAYDRCIGVGGLPDDCAIVLRDRTPSEGE